MSESTEKMMELLSELESVDEVFPVGRYIEVKAAPEAAFVSMGNHGGYPKRGWRIVRVDWREKRYMLAPKEDLE